MSALRTGRHHLRVRAEFPGPGTFLVCQDVCKWDMLNRGAVAGEADSKTPVTLRWFLKSAKACKLNRGKKAFFRYSPAACLLTDHRPFSLSCDRFRQLQIGCINDEIPERFGGEVRRISDTRRRMCLVAQPTSGEIVWISFFP